MATTVRPIKLKNCLQYEVGSQDYQKCLQFNNMAKKINAMLGKPGGEGHIPADMLILIEDFLTDLLTEAPEIQEDQLILEVINLVRDNQFVEQAIDLSRAFTNQLNGESTQNLVILSRNMQLQGRMLESVGKSLEARQSFDLALQFSQLAGRMGR